jgi:hypothetical protein
MHTRQAASGVRSRASPIFFSNSFVAKDPRLTLQVTGGLDAYLMLMDEAA